MGTPSGPPTGGRSRHLVVAEQQAGLDALPADIGPDLLPLVREAREQLVADMVLPPADGSADGVRRDDLVVPGPAGAPDVPVLVYTPLGATGPLPAVLHLHGGGYVFGKAGQNDPHNRLTALEVGCVVVSVDYRLAPETPHPGPVEDTYAALVWLHDHAADLGVDPERIAVKGESAGGGLAACLALLARDRGGPALVHQHLVYPMLDDRTVTTADPNPYAGEFVWTPGSNRFGWAALLGADPGGPDVSPYAAAARADDLTGLPSTFVVTGALDLFLDEDLVFTSRLARAGVPVELHVLPGTVHGYYSDLALEATQVTLRDGFAALRSAFA